MDTNGEVLSTTWQCAWHLKESMVCCYALITAAYNKQWAADARAPSWQHDGPHSCERGATAGYGDGITSKAVRL